ncbi:DUF5677 domain-containing protein [Lentzea sp. NPDC058436]|uniref:DUF5677 domain-containing protein n=1 Tax=Lentzea sp. NPDC058436 TaxID=3346499 RepID=UPI003665BC6E
MTSSHPAQPPTTASDDQEGGAKARSAILHLTDAFDAMVEAEEIAVQVETSHVFKAMYGWWVGIVRSSKAVVLLHDNGLDREAEPIVRSIVQHALTLQWVVDVGDEALDAITEHGENERDRMLGHAKRAGWSFPGDDGDSEPRAAGGSHRLLPMVKNFAALCAAYDAQSAYVVFCLLSGTVHPSVAGATAYFDDELRLNSAPVRESFAGLIATAACLVQTMKTINRLLADNPFDDAIDRAESALGMRVDPPVLKAEFGPQPPDTMPEA